MSVHAEVPQEGAIGAKPAALGHWILGACPAQESRIEEGHLRPRASGDGEQAGGSDAAEARVLMKSHLSSQNPL